MKTIFILFYFLTFSIFGYAAEKLYQVQVSSVQERSLYGGLGSSHEPIGSTTEFFVAELFSVPLVSIAGSHADYFKDKIIYIFKENNYFVCPQNKFDKNCIACYECDKPETQKNLKKFDVANAGTNRKKLIKALQFSATSSSASVTGKDLPTVEFQFPQKGKSPMSLILKHKEAMYIKNPTYATEENKIYIFKSEEDPNYYACQRPEFAPSCFLCTNCKENIDRINIF